MPEIVPLPPELPELVQQAAPDIQIPPGYTSIDLDINPGTHEMEIYALGSFSIFTQTLAGLLHYTSETGRYISRAAPLDQCTETLCTHFETLKNGYEAGRDYEHIRASGSIAARENYYDVKNGGLPVPTIDTLQEVAASVGVSKWKIGISAGLRGNSRYAGKGFSVLFANGNIEEGTNDMSHELPDVYRVIAMKVDPEIRLILIVEGEWALKRLIKEGFLIRLSSTCPTLVICLGGMPSDNTKFWVQQIAKNRSDGTHLVITGDRDVEGLRICAVVKLGADVQLGDMRTPDLYYAPMLPAQITARAHLRRPLKQDKITIADTLSKSINDPTIKLALESLVSSRHKLSLSALRGPGDTFSKELWKMITSCTTEPQQRAENPPPEAPAPLYSIQAILTQLDQVPPVFGPTDRSGYQMMRVGTDRTLAIHPGKMKFWAQLGPDKAQKRQMSITQLHASVNQDQIKNLHTIYSTLMTILGHSTNPEIQNATASINQYLENLVTALRPLHNPAIDREHAVAEAVIYRNFAFDKWVWV